MTSLAFHSRRKTINHVELEIWKLYEYWYTDVLLLVSFSLQFTSHLGNYYSFMKRLTLYTVKKDFLALPLFSILFSYWFPHKGTLSGPSGLPWQLALLCRVSFDNKVIW